MIIFVLSHFVIALCCAVVVVTILYVLYKRPVILTHPTATLTIVMWLAAKAAVHASYVVQVLWGVNVAPTTLVLLSINSVASVTSAICVVFLLLKLMRQPTIRELRTVNDELAKKLAETTRVEEIK